MDINEKKDLEFLILNEDRVDWEKISRDPTVNLSLIETKLFRKRINWTTYILTHPNNLSENILDIASKYFTPATYQIFSMTKGICSEEFILKHKDQINICKYIINNVPSASFLEETLHEWIDNDEVKEKLPKIIDLSQPEYNSIKLLLEID